MKTVSLVIPCYNQACFLEEAVYSCLEQTRPPQEIIVVNDGSSNPEDMQLLHSFHKPGVTLIHQENRGRSAARNAGIAAARGEYILCLDADDKIAPTFLEKAMVVLQERPDVGLVTCRAEFFGNKQGEWRLADPEIAANLLFDHCIPSTCALFRKGDWEKTGGFDPELKGTGEDFDFFLSLVELGRTVYKIPEILFRYRKHQGAITHRMSGLGMREKYQASFAVNDYILKKHINLYLRHMEILVPRLFHRMTEDMPRNPGCKRRKYALLMRLYATLGKIPPLAAWGGKKSARAERKLAALNFYAELKGTVLAGRK